MSTQNLWDRLLCAYAEGEWDLIEELAARLLEQLDRGDDPPQITLHPGLGAEWNLALARAGCLHALETVQGRWSIA